jgi:hypothetical protein
MAETGTEYTGYTIIFALTVGVILLVFGLIAIVAYSAAHGNICLASALVRNFYYNDLCFPSIGGLGSPFCLTSTLSGLGLMPPLECPTQVASYSGNVKATDIWDRLSSMMTTCLNQYGFSSGLQVNYNGPLFCGVVTTSVNYTLTLSSFFNYLENKIYNKSVNSCLLNPHACPQGYSCDTQNPNLCETTTANYSICSSQSNYVATYPGYSLETIPLVGDTISAANNMSQYLCDAAQGCYFNATLGKCVSTLVPFCEQVWQNFCFSNSSGKYCHVQYSSELLPHFLPPLSCNVYTKVNATYNETYFDFLSPGGISLFTVYNPSTGAVYKGNQGLYQNLSHAQIYVYYLNSFTGTHLPPNSYSSPPGCPPFTIYNSISSTCWFTDCVRSFAVAPAFSYGPFKGVGIAITGTAITGAFVDYIGSQYSKGALSMYFNYGVQAFAKVYGTVIFQTSGFQQCASCIWNSMAEHVTPDSIILGSNRLLVCIDV